MSNLSWRGCAAGELSELRRVNAFLQTKLADVEHELHATREQNLALQTKRSTAQEELAELASRFDAAESSKAELATLVDEVRHAPARVLRLLGSGLWGLQESSSQPLPASFTCRGIVTRQKGCDSRSMECCFSGSCRTFQ